MLGEKRGAQVAVHLVPADVLACLALGQVVVRDSLQHLVQEHLSPVRQHSHQGIDVAAYELVGA